MVCKDCVVLLNKFEDGMIELANKNDGIMRAGDVFDLIDKVFYEDEKKCQKNQPIQN
jgi:hypothetical protein